MYLSLSGCQSESSSNPPNIILIVTDDQGYGDLSCHGNTYISTPNMDQLYKESVRFTDFHVDPTCAPTRAALMTGKYSHHAGVWHTVNGGNHLRSTETTMADVFKSAGYSTALFGKWHLGSNYPYRPIDRGFDEWLGQGDGGTGTTDDWFFNDRVNDYYWHNGEREKREGYAPDVFYNAAIDFITASKDTEKPFFVYLPTYLPHHPHTVPDIALTNKYGPEVAPYVSYFFAGIEQIDQNIGRLREALETSGQSKNTIIIFMSDNGGTAGVKLFNAGMRGRKAQVYEGGHRVPFFIHWPNGNIAHGTNVNDLTSHIDVLPTLMDLCNLSSNEKVEFDGRSFEKQLSNPQLRLPERTLFVENQRTVTSMPWHETAGMLGKWRLVDNKELYNLNTDPGQTNNIIETHPDIVDNIRKEHEAYWNKVTPGDRDLPHFIIGHPDDPETFLSTSEWYMAKELWNHAQIAKGSPLAGKWNITVSQTGTYRFELRRWPKEANAPLQGVPDFSNKTIDAWDVNGPVTKLIYGSEMKALPISAVKLEVDNYSKVKTVNSSDTHIVFDVPLKKGDVQVEGTLLDSHGNKPIGGAYYVYVKRL